MAELSEGLWIAKGPSINVLLRLSGTAPMLKVMGAIDLNHFYKTGSARELNEDSIEVLTIMQYPENYVFSKPSTSDAILENTDVSYAFEKAEITDEAKEDITKFYQDLLPGGKDLAWKKTAIYVMATYKLKLNQANYVITCIINRLKHMA
jgi:hypothetical protein